MTFPFLRRTSLALGAATVLLSVAACSSAGGSAAPASSAPAPSAAGACPTSQPPALPAGETRTVTINTALGDIVLKADADLSPIAVGNFVALADCGFYDGVVFHRVVPGFVIQGGDGEHGRTPDVDPALVGTGGPGYTIEDEPVTSTYGRGVVAMARSNQPDSVGSQFFIVLDDKATDVLASYNTYQIIGAVTSGMETADAIAAAADAESPSHPVVMTKVSVARP
jgi:cyclophilin family peptidyl-prolyl cis-trans isomerase